MAERIAADVARGGATVLPHERLSDREFEIFRLLGSGKSVTDIARSLNLSVKTVSSHRTRIMEKTGLRDNAGIVAYVFSHGLQ
jgi:DNA-binding NarL/FixJ family response regulator